jgi:8-oxo-dGTP pyrophosphatase MutT (NUDIX family)
VIIATGDEKILLVRQCHNGKNLWLAPGGAIEPGENSHDAAIREVLEETGLVISVGRLLWHIEEVSEDRGQRFVNYFMCEVIGGVPSLGEDPELGDEQVLEGMGFFSREEMQALENVFPEYLKDELWERLADEGQEDTYKVRT